MDEERLSNCCVYPENEWYNSDSGICGACRDHCDFITEYESELEEFGWRQFKRLNDIKPHQTVTRRYVISNQYWEKSDV